MDKTIMFAGFGIFLAQAMLFLVYITMSFVDFSNISLESTVTFAIYGVLAIVNLLAVALITIGALK